MLDALDAALALMTPAEQRLYLHELQREQELHDEQMQDQ